MDGQQRVGIRVVKLTHQTDRHSVDLLALIYQAILDDSTSNASRQSSEQQTSATTSLNEPIVQEALT